MNLKEKITNALIFSLMVFFIIVVSNKTGLTLPLKLENLVTNKTELYQVSAEGKVVVAPDVAYIRLQIEKEGKNIIYVKDEATKVYNQLIDKLKEIGIEEKNISTENYYLYTVHDWNSENQRISGYRAFFTLKVKIYPLEKVNQVIDEATALGVNNIGDVDFDVFDKERYINEARKIAIEKAKKEAYQASKVAGFRLGKIVNYTEDQPSNLNVPVSGGGSAKITEVQPGNQEIKVRVNLSYQIE